LTRTSTGIFMAPALSIVAGGCASFRAAPRDSERLPISGVAWKPSVSVVIGGEGVLDGKKRDLPVKALEHFRDLTKRAYEESGRFSEVRIGLDESDIRAEVQVINRGVANRGLAFLSGLTLLVLPAKAVDSFTVETRFASRDGNDLGHFERSEDVTTWFELILIFATPFAWPNSVIGDVLVDLNHGILDEAAARGVFERPPASTAGATSAD
jgi:hypothetical protein